jgi:hypothetical protein
MTPDPPGLDREIILNEISGKNAAIHTYERICWQIRSGFLTLFFLAWGIILKSYAEGTGGEPQAMQSLIFPMFAVSAGLTLGGWFVDLSYLRYKFRVVIALNELIAAVWAVGDRLRAVPVDFLKVAWDCYEMPYDCLGYREARRTGICVFGIPLATVGIVALLLR